MSELWNNYGTIVYRWMVFVLLFLAVAKETAPLGLIFIFSALFAISSVLMNQAPATVDTREK